MPPKRSKKTEGSSQPLPEAQKPVRTSGRKRRASDASSVQSEAPASSQAAMTGAPAKKRKTRKDKTAASEEPETIVEEEEVVVTQAPQVVAYPTLDTVNEVEAATAGAMDETEDHTQSRHVHFGSDDAVDKSTATHKTPHTKMAIKRRVTESPSASVSASASPKRYRTITHRTSLPALLSEEHHEPIHVVQEHRFVSLREALDERIRRHMRRSQAGEISAELDDLNTNFSIKELENLRKETADKEARINQLVFELESQRQLGIDANYDSKAEQERLRSVELELEVLRKQVLLNRARGHLDNQPDQNMMVLDSQEEIAYPRLGREEQIPATPSGAKKRSTLSAELRTSGGELALPTPGHRQWEDERRRFQDSILALSREANEATANLQILDIELRSLGFSEGDDVDGLTIVRSIRESFELVREKLDLILPGTVPEGASNEEILDLLMVNVKEFADQLRIRDRENQEQIALNTDLRIQIDKLIDHLAASEIRIKILKQRWRELDEGSERKERDLEDLEAEIESAEEENKALEAALKERNLYAQSLETDIASVHSSVERLTASLQGYRDEETRLQNIITKMEEAHAAAVIKMNTEREATVLDLESRLNAENALRDEAEKENDARQVIIHGLEARILAVETERDTLHVEFQKAQADLTAERMVREQTETDMVQKDVEMTDLVTRVNNLDDELNTMNAELEELRGMNEAERRQREAAETDLDDRNAEIEDLNQKLHDRGTEANSLRQKLFEVQQQNTIKVKELEDAASDRDAQYQEDIAEEVGRREDAEEVIRVREALITDLQASLTETEERMAALLALRDARIVELEAEVADKTAEIALLQGDLRDAESRMSLQVTEDQGRREELEASILSLQTTITGYETTIQTMEREATQATDLHNSEIDDRNSAIASLNHNVAVLQGKVADLEKDKAGLEHRVNAEAEAMLILSSDKEDEINRLQNELNKKQEKILLVEQKVRDVDNNYLKLLEERDAELENMRAQAETTTTTVEEISMQRDSLKQQFEAYIRRSAGVIDNLKDALEKARNTVDNEGDALKAEGGDLLEQLEGLDVVTEMVSKKKVTTQTHSSSQSSAGASRKTPAKASRKKRIYDSGFGVASDEFEDSVAN